MKPIRLGIAGLAHDHCWWTIDHILANSDAELVGVAEPQGHLRDRAAGQVGASVPLYENIRQLLDQQRPDALIAMTANAEHRSALELAASYGVHFFTHKPCAASLTDARHMLRVASESGIRTMVNNHWLWRPDHQEFLRLVRAGTIGEVVRLVSYCGHQGPKGIGLLSDDYIRYLYDPGATGGGALIDQATYGLNYAAVILGLPKTVYASIRTYKADGDGRAEDDATLLLNHANATTTILASYCWPSRRVEVEAIGRLDGRFVGLQIRDGGLFFEPERPPGFSPTQAMVREAQPLPVPVPPPHMKNGIAHFIHGLATGENIEAGLSLETHVLVQTIVDAAYQSARSDRVVSLLGGD